MMFQRLANVFFHVSKEDLSYTKSRLVVHSPQVSRRQLVTNSFRSPLYVSSDLVHLPELPDPGRKISSCAEYGDCWSYVNCPHGKKPCPTINSQKESWTHLETFAEIKVGSSLAYQAQWWPHKIYATSMPSASLISALHPLTGLVPSLSVPQDSAFGVAKFF